jgi:hypothetical protein
VHEALAKGNRNSRAVAGAGGLGCVGLVALMLAASSAWADRPDQAAADPAADGTSPQAATPVATPAPIRKADRLLELVVAYLDNAFDAGRRVHRDVAPDHVGDDSGQ